MSDFALLFWGAMIGSWITSLWIMRKSDAPSPMMARIMEMAGKVDRARLFAPDCVVKVDQKVRVGDALYMLSMAPVDQDPH